MIYIGKGVSVDVIKHPYVFGIDGWDPIRIQKGEGRITGVTVGQLKIIVATVEGSADEEVEKENKVEWTHIEDPIPDSELTLEAMLAARKDLNKKIKVAKKAAK